MYCIIKCTVQGKQARVKNADLRHPSCTSASPVLNVLMAYRATPNTTGFARTTYFLVESCYCQTVKI